MKMIFTQAEIEQILRDHVDKTVTLATGADYAIDFVAKRDTDGITATIDIPYMGVSALELPKPVTPLPIDPGSAAAANAKPVRKTKAATSVFANLTPATPAVQDAPAEQATAVAAADTAEDDAPFPDAVPADESSQETPTEPVDSSPAPKTGKSLFAN